MAKKDSGSSPSRIIVFIVVIIGLFIASIFGLVDVNWSALLSGEDPDQVLVDLVPTVEDPKMVATEPPTTKVVATDVPAQEDWYQLYFTQINYPDDPTTRVDTIAQALIEIINSAEESLDIAIYELNLEEIGDALLAARERGVTVRIVTDTDELEEEELMIHLEEEGFPIVADERSAIMHNKFMVVDGQAVWTGSWNFTHNGTYRNNNHGIYIQSPELAENYTTEFEEMFSEQAFGPTSPENTVNPQITIGDTMIETCFAPEDECGLFITNTVQEAQESIYFMAFSFTHDEIGQVVRQRANAGVEVHGLFENRGSSTQYSEFGQMEELNLDVLQDGNPYVLHHKVFVLDGDTVILGSFNFSANADNSNDENILVIHDNSEIAQQFIAEFEQLQEVAKNPPN